MRLLHPNLTQHEKYAITTFSSWLLQVGDGNLGKPDSEDPVNAKWIEIPLELCIEDHENAMAELIHFIYDKVPHIFPAAIRTFTNLSFHMFLFTMQLYDFLSTYMCFLFAG